MVLHTRFLPHSHFHDHTNQESAYSSPLTKLRTIQISLRSLSCPGTPPRSPTQVPPPGPTARSARIALSCFPWSTTFMGRRRRVRDFVEYASLEVRLTSWPARAWGSAFEDRRYGSSGTSTGRGGCWGGRKGRFRV